MSLRRGPPSHAPPPVSVLSQALSMNSSNSLKIFDDISLIISETDDENNLILGEDLRHKLKEIAQRCYKYKMAMGAAMNTYHERRKGNRGLTDIELYSKLLHTSCENVLRGQTEHNSGATGGGTEESKGDSGNEVAGPIPSVECDQQNTGVAAGGAVAEADTDEATILGEEEDLEQTQEQGIDSPSPLPSSTGGGNSVMQNYKEDLRKLRDRDGPLHFRRWVRISYTVKTTDGDHIDFIPTTPEILNMADKIELPFPGHGTDTNTLRVAKYFRMGKLYAMIDGEQVAMASKDEMQEEVDIINTQHGTNLSLQTWLRSLKDVLILSRKAKLLKKKAPAKRQRPKKKAKGTTTRNTRNYDSNASTETELGD